MDQLQSITIVYNKIWFLSLSHTSQENVNKHITSFLYAVLLFCTIKLFEAVIYYFYPKKNNRLKLSGLLIFFLWVKFWYDD